MGSCQGLRSGEEVDLSCRASWAMVSVLFLLGALEPLGSAHASISLVGRNKEASKHV